MTSRSVTHALATAACALGILAGPTIASGEYIARNKLRVIPTTENGAMMEVYAKPGAAAPQYFCAAADYALRRLGSNPSDRVAVARAEAPSTTRPGFTSVLFVVRPWQTQRAPNPSLLLDIDRVGEEEVIGLSRKRCSRLFRRLL